MVTRFKENLLIGGNGSIVSDNGAIQVIDYISNNDYMNLKKIIKENNLNYIIDGAFDYSAKVDSSNLIYRQLDPMHLAKNVSMDEIEQPIKIILIDIPENFYEDICQNLADIDDNISVNYHRTDSNIDITAREVNKYSTLKKYIEDHDYIGYGNDINDYDLLKHAQKSYYISNDKNIDLNYNVTEVLPKDVTKIALSIQSHLKNEVAK